MTKEKLFLGESEPLGGLSNEKELAGICPKEFQKNNPWSDYANELFLGGGDICNWKWKTTNEVEKHKQFDCFHSLLGTFGLSHEDKEAVAGWMLSEMLMEIPTISPLEMEPLNKREKGKRKRSIWRNPIKPKDKKKLENWERIFT